MAIRLKELVEYTLSLQWNDFWKLSSFWGDCGYYFLQSENLSLSISPYKYRILPTSIALGIHKLTGLPLVLSYVLMNILFAYLIGIVFTYWGAPQRLLRGMRMLGRLKWRVGGE